MYARIRPIVGTGCRTIFMAVFLFGLTSAYADEPVLTYEPADIIENESENCAQCHERAIEAWSVTTHKITYDELHLRDEAQAVIERLGMSGSIRRNAECVQCHYTQSASEVGGRASTVMGVSCQRCHGAAANWVDIHQDVETHSDRDARIRLAVENGMRPTDSVYTLATSCFQCHTVPREDLVNVGEHPAGTDDFDLVAYSQGEVRHNFLPLPDEAENKVTPRERLRLMYVIGKILDLEFSLRGLALATGDGPYLEAMGARAQGAFDSLSSLKLGISELDSILAAVPKDGDAVKAAPNDSASYTAAADTIRPLAQSIDDKHESYATNLAAVDSSLPTEYMGEVYE